MKSGTLLRIYDGDNLIIVKTWFYSCIAGLQNKELNDEIRKHTTVGTK